MDLGDVLPEFEDRAYPMLRLVDPYGDTVFSRYQMVALIPELQTLVDASGDPRLTHLLKLAEQVERRPHAFLVFLGD